MIDEQAEKKARGLIEQVAHSMSLEDQSLDEKEIEIQIKSLKDEMKRGNLSKIWD
jgi:hypothetical protein